MIVKEEYIVQEENLNIRFVDYCIDLFPQITTKNAVKKAIKRKEIIHNGKEASTGAYIRKGDTIQLIDRDILPPKEFILPIDIVYEDEYLVVVNKPSGIVVSGNQYQTLENAMVNQISISNEKDALKWAKPVHRLDSATSGLLLMSKTMSAHRKLGKMFEEKLIEKEYHALVMGEPEKNSGKLEIPIDEKKSVSNYKVLKTVNSLRSEKISLLKLIPETGRTHQLRIHCAAMGNPIVGDVLYGEKGNTLLHKGLFLAATKLKLNHPILENLVEFRIEIPNKFISLLEREERRFEKFKMNDKH